MSEPAKLQYRTRSNTHPTDWEWVDVPQEGSRANGPTNGHWGEHAPDRFYLSSCANFRGDLEIRIKPEFVPGYFRHFADPGTDHRALFWYVEDPGPNYRRVEVTPVDE